MAQLASRMAYSPKVAKVTPKSTIRASHCVDLAVRVRTKPDQARVTGRIG
jgi:hypothetical protein